MHPTKGESQNKERERERGPKSLAEAEKPTGDHKGAKEQEVMFQSSHRSREAY